MSRFADGYYWVKTNGVIGHPETHGQPQAWQVAKCEGGIFSTFTEGVLHFHHVIELVEVGPSILPPGDWITGEPWSHFSTVSLIGSAGHEVGAYLGRSGSSGVS